MPPDRTGVAALFFGRTRRTTERFVAIVTLCFFALTGLAVSLSEPQVHAINEFRYWQGFVVVVVVGVSAIHAFRNDGLLVGVGLAYVLLEGLILGGFIPVATLDGSPPGPYLLAALPLGFAIVLGTGGFLLGAVGRRIWQVKSGSAASSS